MSAGVNCVCYTHKKQNKSFDVCVSKLSPGREVDDFIASQSHPWPGSRCWSQVGLWDSEGVNTDKRCCSDIRILMIAPVTFLSVPTLSNSKPDEMRAFNQKYMAVCLFVFVWMKSFEGCEYNSSSNNSVLIRLLLNDWQTFIKQIMCSRLGCAMWRSVK